MMQLATIAKSKTDTSRKCFTFFSLLNKEKKKDKNLQSPFSDKPLILSL